MCDLHPEQARLLEHRVNDLEHRMDELRNMLRSFIIYGAGVWHAGVAFTLLVDADRLQYTPSVTGLLTTLPPQAWAGMFCLVAISLVAAGRVSYPRYVRAAFVMAAAISAYWAAGYLVERLVNGQAQMMGTMTFGFWATVFIFTSRLPHLAYDDGNQRWTPAGR
jgi:hypothetical protein